MSDLFRAEVVERQTNRLHGEVLVLPRFSHSVILGLLLVWVLAVGAWLLFSSYARKETVQGWLEPPEGLIRVYPEDAGVIAEILVHEGEGVQEGQPLVVVNRDRALANGEDLEQRLLDEYQSQHRLVEEQIAATSRLHEGRREDVEQRLAAAREDVALLEQQTVTLNSRHSLVVELVERYRLLRTQGHVSQSDLDAAVEQELALRNEQQGLSREKASRGALVEQLAIELNSLPEEGANELSQLRVRLSDLAQKVAQLQGQRAHVIKAARSGKVNNLQARIGERIQAGNIPLLTLIPSGAPLAANLLIPVRSAGFIAPGQRLDIRYDAFPYQKFGLYVGEVVTVSDTVVLPGELSNVPLRVEEPVYRVTARLEQSAVLAYGREFDLKPGMTLSADVGLGERTLLQWLLDPIFSIMGRL
jgi:membrane fusion protein